MDKKKLLKGVILFAALVTTFVTGRKLFAGRQPVNLPPVNNCLGFQITFPISKGYGIGNVCERPAVEKVQKWINKNIPIPLRPIAVDGQFGTATETALETITGKKTVQETEYLKM